MKPAATGFITTIPAPTTLSNGTIITTTIIITAILKATHKVPNPDKVAGNAITVITTTAIIIITTSGKTTPEAVMATISIRTGNLRRSSFFVF